MRSQSRAIVEINVGLRVLSSTTKSLRDKAVPELLANRPITLVKTKDASAYAWTLLRCSILFEHNRSSILKKWRAGIANSHFPAGDT